MWKKITHMGQKSFVTYLKRICCRCSKKNSEVEYEYNDKDKHWCDPT